MSGVLRHARLSSTIRAGRLRLWGESLTELDDLVQLIAKIFESRQGDDDGVTATINLLDDSQEPSTRVLSQVKREMLPFNSDIVVL